MKHEMIRQALAGLVGLSALLGRPVMPAEAATVKAAVVRSTGTYFLGQTIWPELNADSSPYGDVPVEIDYTSLAGSNITLSQIEATEADVLILSAAGYITYGANEIVAIRDYVEAGHGLLITYYSFHGLTRYLAPLVGLSDTIMLGTGTAIDPIEFDSLAPGHLLFSGIDEHYVSGVPFLATPINGIPWDITTGVALATRYSATMPETSGIIANETAAYRGLYFSHYPENFSGGANSQDFQLVYNGIMWTAGVPEPHSAWLVIMAAAWLIGSRSRLRRRSSPARRGCGSAAGFRRGRRLGR